MTDAYIKIFKNEGLKGFWSGCAANMTRNSIFNACELASYDQTREYVLKNNLMKYLNFCIIEMNYHVILLYQLLLDFSLLVLVNQWTKLRRD